MSKRVSDNQITMRVARLQAEGMNIGLDGQYGQFRITNREGNADVSPRLPNRQIMDFLDGYETGWDDRKAYIAGGKKDRAIAS